MCETLMTFLGKRLRQIREERGLTLDDVATASQHFGTNWTSATISSMERGGSNVARLDVLILLTDTLTFLDKDGDVVPMALADWFDIWGKRDGKDVVIAENDRIELNDEVSTTRNELAAALTGEPPTLFPLAGTKGQRQSAYEVWSDKTNADMGDFVPLCLHLPHVITLSERRAAKKLGMDAKLFSIAVQACYGRYLDEEVAARAGEGATPQKRGRVTREILKEMKQRMDDARNDDDASAD